jgi:hypothetical protein
MRSSLHAITPLLAATVLGGCVSTSLPLEVGRDTYSVSASTGDRLRAAAARQSAFEAGREMCAKQGKRFMLVSETTSRSGTTTVDVTFRCLHENDPEYTRPSVRPAPDVIIEDQRK